MVDEYPITLKVTILNNKNNLLSQYQVLPVGTWYLVPGFGTCGSAEYQVARHEPK
jgi:hypothetical protein